jgi:hypothetical protein
MLKDTLCVATHLGVLTATCPCEVFSLLQTEIIRALCSCLMQLRLCESCLSQPHYTTVYLNLVLTRCHAHTSHLCLSLCRLLTPQIKYDVNTEILKPFVLVTSGTRTSDPVTPYTKRLKRRSPSRTDHIWRCRVRKPSQLRHLASSKAQWISANKLHKLD